jgi:hypothetical protein
MSIRIAVPGLLVALLLAVAACSTVDANRMPGVDYPPRPADWPVAVLVHPFAPALLIDAVGKNHLGLGPEGAEVIGEFRCEEIDYSSSRAVPLRKTIAAAQAEAREMGGDAILIRAGRASSDGSEVRGEVLRYAE